MNVRVSLRIEGVKEACLRLARLDLEIRTTKGGLVILQSEEFFQFPHAGCEEAVNTISFEPAFTFAIDNEGVEQTEIV